MKDLISFETAKLAKEKGYDLLENQYYIQNKDGEIVLDNGDGDCEFIRLNHNKYDNYYSAPTKEDYQKGLDQKQKEEIDYLNQLVNMKKVIINNIIYTINYQQTKVDDIIYNKNSKSLSKASLFDADDLNWVVISYQL